MRPVLAVSAFLEQKGLPRPRSTVGLALGAAWERALGRAVVRQLAIAPGLRVVAVGGATLGGSGKTPLAVACAAELARAREGLRVALVGHAYRATPGRARVVSPTDALSEVGDEALLAARAFERSSVRAADGRAAVRVVVGPTRQSAIDLAARVADVVVVDGVTQTAPSRADLALLAVDSEEPWGRAAAVPPWGDLRAPVESLVDAVDRVVTVGDAPGAAILPGAAHARVASDGAWLGDELLSWVALAELRVGLLCALARPERVLRSLARRGVQPAVVVRGRDHGPLPPVGDGPASRGARGQGCPAVDLWVATPKCAIHASMLNLSAPLATLEHRVELPGDLAATLTAMAQGNNLETSRNVSQKAAGAPSSQLGLPGQLGPRGRRTDGRGQGQHA